MDEPIHTTYQISRYCAVNISTVMDWIDGGKLRAFKTPGGHRRVLRSDLLEFLRTYGMPVPEELRAAKRVLIVDDEALIIRLVERVARGLDPAFEFATAANGFEAGRKFAAFAPDLVVLDLMLPGLDGFAVCRAMREGQAAPPRGAGGRAVRILAISGFDTEENKERILSCGADDYLGKPLAPGPLAEKIARLLGLRAKGAPPAGEER